MSHIQINFDEVPDQVQPVAAGEYIVVIENAEVQDTKKGDGQKVVVEMKISDENNPMFGRKLFDHIGLKNPISLKRLCKSAGVSVGSGGLNVEDLVGKTAEVRVKIRTYKDPESGETKETPSIADYLIRS